MSPILPLLLVCAAGAVCAALETGRGRAPKAAILLIALLASASSIGESSRLSYSYTLKDTRTLAKDWIEANLPQGSKVLMDLTAYSPPLESSKEQLEKFYAIAEKTNSYKKEYFRLKLETLDPMAPAYEIFLLQRAFQEIGSIASQVEQAQAVQDLVQVEGKDSDFRALQSNGIQFVITNSWAEKNALSRPGALAEFYKALPSKAQELQTFLPDSSLQPGPEIRVYRLP